MDKYIEIRLTKTVLYLTESEIRKLLHKDNELYTVALKRGKAFKRARQRTQRDAERGEGV